MSIVKTVSVVLATYNGERYIKQQLETIANQSYPIREVIIFDDKSVDRTVSIIKQFIKKRSLDNWKLHVNEQNIGWRCNFIQAINSSKGDIIFLADQDDIWKKDKVEKMVFQMQNNSRIEVLASNLLPIYEKGGQKRQKIYTKKYGQNLLEKVNRKKYCFEIIRPGCCMCFKKEIIPLINKTWHSRLAHDYVIWGIGSLRETLYIYNETLIYQRRHKDNNTPISQHRALRRKESLQLGLDYLKKMYSIKADLNLSNYNEQILIKGMQYYQCRINLIMDKSIKNCIKALEYIRFYPKFLSYIADVFAV
jgi:Glycosyltransferases, probably involved in cell wall biogenesis